jgi:hypothetical protein
MIWSRRCAVEIVTIDVSRDAPSVTCQLARRRRAWDTIAYTIQEPPA